MIRAFGAPHRYLQGPGALQELATLVPLYGRRPFALVDAALADSMRERLQAMLGDPIEAIGFGVFSGECTAMRVHEMAQAAAAMHSDVVLGIGGGKAIDSAKGVRILRGGSLIVVPTIASNDAPTSRLVVLYHDDHVLSEVRMMPTNPDAVVVDTEIIVNAPRRFFVAGIGDALSKKFEVEQCDRSGGLNFYKAHPTALAVTIADQCYHTLRAHALDALAAIGRKAPNDAFERVTEATILSSGLGFESGGLSIAHALTRGFSAIPSLAGALHGEQVAFGLLVQLRLEKRPAAFISELRTFYRQLGLPVNLSDLGFFGNEKGSAIRIIAERTVADAPYVQQFQTRVDAHDLAEAIAQADE